MPRLLQIGFRAAARAGTRALRSGQHRAVLLLLLVCGVGLAGTFWHLAPPVGTPSNELPVRAFRGASSEGVVERVADRGVVASHDPARTTGPGDRSAAQRTGRVAAARLALVRSPRRR